MKKLFLSIFAILLPVSISAAEVQINGLWYNLVSKFGEAEVIQYKDDNNRYSGNIVIPENVEYEGKTYTVTSIGYRAFFWSNITSVAIPKTIKSIGGEAFVWCGGFSSIYITDLEAWCNITKEYCCEYNQQLHLYLNGAEVKDMVIPNGVTAIKDNAFSQIVGITSVTIPDGVTSIGNSAFSGCKGIASVSIPSSVTSIGDYSFQNCYSLTSVTIPSSVTYLGSAFCGCSSLTSVNIPTGITTITWSAFQECTSLTSVTIPNNVENIYDQAFYECKSLKTINIGTGVHSIGNLAFANCEELTDVYCLAENVPYCDENPFEGSYIDYATLHVQDAAVEKYMAQEPWKNFKAIVGLGGLELPKCATPTISFSNGELVFRCETEGVEFVSEVTVSDAKKNYGNKISLTGVYKVSVYATKTGFEDSEVVTEEFTMGSGGLKGDTNGDGKVDVEDVVETVNIILGE